MGEEFELKNQSVLRINLDHPYTDRAPEKNKLNFGNETTVSGLNDLHAALSFAKTDSRIQGVYLHVGSLSAAPATLLAMHNELLDFKKSGKWIIAYGENYTQGAYFVASASNEIYMYPTGSFDWRGLNAEITFYKKLLDNLEIEAQVIRGPNNKFKSAVEPFIYDHMSEPNREQLSNFIGDIWNVMLDHISTQRNISVDALQTAANNLSFVSNNELMNVHMIDGLLYPDQVWNRIAEKLKSTSSLEDEKELESEFVSLAKYAPLAKKALTTTSQDDIAVVYAIGGIESGKGDDETIGSDRIAKALRDARLDENVKAIVFRVNSPGGSALASDVIWRETQLIKASGKPLVVSMGDYAASGGYYISCFADRIYAEPTTITGSIGVFGIIPNLQNFLDHKLGITTDQYETNPHAGMMGVTHPLDTVEKVAMQQMIGTIYHDFTSKVAQGRNLSIEFVDSIGQGRVWSGVDALGLGLVDELGGLQAAIAYAAQKANMSEYEISEYPTLLDPLEEFLKQLSNDPEALVLQRVLGNRYTTYKHLKQMSSSGVYQSRLPFELVIE
jgi:protease-4